ncbi:MAG: DUF4469 domain-containing protein [Treponema sp.]|nr:DUF4469 domain-containing protein [Treponema sp.]
MNLMTLAAEEADYKSGSLPVALYPNAMRREADGKQTFYARPIIREHLSMDDIASDMVVAGVNNGLSREQITALWNNINCAVLDRVANSCSVDTGLCLCSTKISGTFETDSDSFSRERHGIDMAFRTGRKVRGKLKELNVVIRQGNAAKPQISDVYDLESGGSERLTRGGYLEVTGSNLTLLGDNASVGLYFVNEDDPEKTIVLGKEKMGTNSPSKLACVVPASLAEGSYRIKVVTQFTRTKVQRKEPQTFTFDRLLQVTSA